MKLFWIYFLGGIVNLSCIALAVSILVSVVLSIICIEPWLNGYSYDDELRNTQVRCVRYFKICLVVFVVSAFLCAFIPSTEQMLHLMP